MLIPMCLTMSSPMAIRKRYLPDHSCMICSSSICYMMIWTALSLTFIGIVRELLGAGSFFGLPIGHLGDVSMTVFILPAGGFLVYGTLMALVNFLTGLAENRKYEASSHKGKAKKEAKV